MPHRARLQIAEVPLTLFCEASIASCFLAEEEYHCYLNRLERLAVQLGMSVGRDRFAELVCATAGVRLIPADADDRKAGQHDFGL